MAKNGKVIQAELLTRDERHHPGEVPIQITGEIKRAFSEQIFN
jgi:hypothetical protein